MSVTAADVIGDTLAPDAIGWEGLDAEPVDRPYASAAAVYVAAGWPGVLPVGEAPREKDWVPPGYTGHGGRWPLPAQVAAWTNARGDRNIGLRLPHGVVGIDVDDYGGKPGRATWEAAIARHGEPPATWTTGSREGLSGIRLYRVPEAETFGGKLTNPDRPAESGIELIQYHHRYAIVWPSIHPEGRRYVWRTPPGGPTIPSPADLPELPAGWVDHLARRCGCWTPETKPLFTIAGDALDGWAAEVRTALTSGGSRHEDSSGPLLRLCAARNRKSLRAARILGELHAEYVAACIDPSRTNVRTPAKAEAEWERLTARGTATTIGLGEPDWEDEPAAAGTTGTVATSTGPAILAPDSASTWPEPPDPAAFHGIAGRIALALAPHTEADPVGLLVTLLTIAGAIIGPGRTFSHGQRHRTNLYVVLVGETAAGRKGTAHSIASETMDRVDGSWRRLQVRGLGSGEGLITRLSPSDAVPTPEPRALVVETELARMLRIIERQGSTLSAVVRDAWDGEPLGRSLASGWSLVTHHHVAMLAHVTPHELRELLSDTDAASGFGNRFLWVAVRRPRLVALPGDPAAAVPGPKIRELASALTWAQHVGTVTLSDAGADDWEARYIAMAGRERHGLLGALTARHEAHVLRLAFLYALLDRSETIDPEHLAAASALWDYAERSTRYVFGDSTGDRLADLFRRHLRDRGELTGTDMKNIGARNPVERQATIDLLVELGLATCESRPTSGRPVLVIVRTDAT